MALCTSSTAASHEERKCGTSKGTAQHPHLRARRRPLLRRLHLLHRRAQRLRPRADARPRLQHLTHMLGSLCDECGLWAHAPGVSRRRKQQPGTGGQVTSLGACPHLPPAVQLSWCGLGARQTPFPPSQTPRTPSRRDATHMVSAARRLVLHVLKPRCHLLHGRFRVLQHDLAGGGSQARVLKRWRC